MYTKVYISTGCHPNFSNTPTIPLDTCCIEAVPNRMRRPIEVKGLEISVLSWHFSLAFHTADGRNPAPIEVGSLSHYLQGFLHPSWWVTSLIWLQRLIVFWHRFFLPGKKNAGGFWPLAKTTGSFIQPHLDVPGRFPCMAVVMSRPADLG